jgi:hypothetical protein
VLVQLTVKVSAVDRFVATSEKFAPMMQEMGGRQAEVYEDGNEPVWSQPSRPGTSHDQMHAASEKHGDQLTRRRGPPGSTGRPTSGTGRGTPDPIAFRVPVPWVGAERSLQVGIRSTGLEDVVQTRDDLARA